MALLLLYCIKCFNYISRRLNGGEILKESLVYVNYYTTKLLVHCDTYMHVKVVIYIYFLTTTQWHPVLRLPNMISLLLPCLLRPRKTANIFLQLVAQQRLRCKLQLFVVRIGNNTCNKQSQFSRCRKLSRCRFYFLQHENLLRVKMKTFPLLLGL